ncbi:MAG: tRNA-2-methylthio-N6-dimethylallyladenosine synthase [Flammeovirgaceae bacterium]|jgi:tRNA-2-methylthio-N6-dimethylallyladenosine synthase
MGDLIKDIGILEGGEQHLEIEATDISKDNATPEQRKLYIESYGCQMNFSDSEIVASVLEKEGFGTTSKPEEADLIFVNTCSIRDKAEQTVRNRLQHFKQYKRKNPDVMVGILGCMAERLKEQLLEEEKIVDLVVGPDAYRDLPNLVADVDDGRKAVNVFLSRDETYADITPVRLNSNGITAFISIMRGCDNMCSFCVVPFTRGRERSRDPYSIVAEAQDLFNKGYREVTLLGQNVDSYKWSEDEELKGKAQIERAGVPVVEFAELLKMVAEISPDLRVRFSTSHPKDMTDDVLYVIRDYENVCEQIHLPVQSGNSRVLKIMNRTYDREWYLNRVEAIRRIIGEDCAISSDMISGFCTETEEEHQDTLTIMDIVKYDFSFMYYYSERPGTLAAKKFADDIPLDVKKRRLNEIIKKQQGYALERNQREIGKTAKVLIEGFSKRSKEHLQGRNSANKVVVFPKANHKAGEYAMVKIEDCTAGTLLGTSVE